MIGGLMTETNNEDRYESIEMILKCRADGESWFDVLFDFITETCEGDPESEENTCTCGMQSFGGSGGTLDQCYRQQGIADDLVGPVNKADLLRALENFTPTNEEDQKIYDRLYNECTWWDATLERWAAEEIAEEEELISFENKEEAIKWLKDEDEL
jgi:hypothetical protein